MSGRQRAESQALARQVQLEDLDLEVVQVIDESGLKHTCMDLLYINLNILFYT